MAVRTWTGLALASAVLAGAASRTSLAADETARNRVEKVTAAARRSDMLDEARLDAELLEQELALEKAALAQFVGALKQLEFGVPGTGFAMMGTPTAAVPFTPVVPGSEGPDDAKPRLAAMRKRYDELKAITLETSKKLAAAQRRVADLEGPSEPPAAADSPPRNDRMAVAERRAQLVLVELAVDVDKALLRDAMAKLGQLELQRSLYPLKAEGAEAAAEGLDRMREYIERKTVSVLKQTIELELKRKELADLAEKVGESK
jgi:hypothetical protein